MCECILVGSKSAMCSGRDEESPFILTFSIVPRCRVLIVRCLESIILSLL